MYVDALRLSAKDQSELFARLDAAGAAFKGGDRRLEARHAYRIVEGLFVQINHPGGSVGHFIVRPRDLSSTGMSFLHGNYVHADSRLIVSLRSLSGHASSVTGRVARCQHVRGRIHEVGVRFDTTLNIGDFVVELAQAETGSQSTELPRLAGALLYVEDSTIDTELLRFYLRSQEVSLTAVSDWAAASAQLENGRFDAALLDADLPGLDLAQVVKTMSVKGRDAAVIALTAHEDEAALAALKGHGVAGVLVKPYSAESLFAALSACLPPASGGDRLASSMWSNEAMRPLIVSFVNDAQEKLRKIEQMVETGDSASLLQLVVEIKAAAGSFGYEKLQHVARDLHQLAKAQTPVDQIRKKVFELSRLADAARRHVEREAQAEAK
jgi:CheY-like chemotaxis protein